MKEESVNNSCNSNRKCPKCLRSVGYYGLFGNMSLVLLKVVVGLAFFSTALLADSLYSILDIGFSILIIVGLRISSKPPDLKHEYGHGKVEFVITIVFSVLTVTGAVALFVFAVFEIHKGIADTFSVYVLITALISAVANLLFYRFTRCIANRFESPSIKSLSLHSHADAISSVLVAVSMGFAYFGFRHVGSFVAIVETVHILFIGSEIFKRSLDGLLDASISPKDIKDIKVILSNVEGVKNVNSVKSRKIGQKIWLNVEIEAPAQFSIDRVDRIKDTIRVVLSSRIKNLEEVMVNVTPFQEDSGSLFSLSS